LRTIVISLALAAATTPVWPAETLSPGDEAEAPAAAADLTVSHPCPACHALNPPEAAYCMACGAALGPQEEATWPRTPSTVALELLTGYGFFTAGFVTAYDGGRWGNELGLAALYDLRDVRGGSLVDRVYFYFSERRLRPYISVEPYFSYADGGDPVGRLAVGGGVRYGYGRYGSYACAGVSVGASASGDRVSPYSSIHARLLYLFTPHVGIGGSLAGFGFGSGVTFGPSFAF